MSQYYTPKRTKGLFDPKSTEPFRLSRSKIDLFRQCSRCFYLDRRLGVGRPPGFPFTLNSAVDFLLKKEFDIHRAKRETHPLMKTYGIDAIPYQHEDMEMWRNTFKGVSCHHTPTNFFVFGAIDDVWINSSEELHIVDYKATSKDGEVTLDAPWQDGYKRQMEVYQWLFRQNNFKVSPTGYFVYANATKDRKAFDGKLEFSVKIIPYTGSSEWIPKTLQDARACLEGDEIPEASPDCDFCAYRDSTDSVIHTQKKDNSNLQNGKLF